MKVQLAKEATQDSDELRPAFKAAAKNLKDVLEGKKPMTDMAKLSSVTVAGFGRILAADVHKMALHLMVERMNSNMIKLPGPNE